MIVDGKEVIYSMKDRKIVYPEIPTEGLVCYLDARGKTNTDKHKGTLIDLSGNGNHGTLLNFNFTEESGYVKGLSSGTSGLQFDGVDDWVSIPQSTIKTGETTIFLKNIINKKQNPSENIIFSSSNGLNPTAGLLLTTHGIAGSFRIRHNSKSYVLIDAPTPETLEIESLLITVNKNNLLKAYLNGVKKIEETLSIPFVESEFNYGIGGVPYTTLRNNMSFEKAMIYNRALTDEEITQLMEV